MLKLLKRTFGDTLYQVRITNGLSQEKMAEKCYMSYREYSDLENGKRLPSLHTFIDIVITTDLNVNLLIKALLERGYKPNDDRNAA